MLTAIVSVETVLLVLLLVLVAALLRSHAEILRRLGPESAARPLEAACRDAARPEPRAAARGDGPAPALSGVTPTGDAVKLAFDGRATTPTLLAFLSTGLHELRAVLRHARRAPAARRARDRDRHPWCRPRAASSSCARWRRRAFPR